MLKRCIQNVGNPMLISKLRELENNQLIHREIYKEVPPRVEYSLTELGKMIMLILIQLEKWGKGYNKKLDIAFISDCSTD